MESALGSDVETDVSGFEQRAANVPLGDVASDVPPVADVAGQTPIDPTLLTPIAGMALRKTFDFLANRFHDDVWRLDEDEERGCREPLERAIVDSLSKLDMTQWVMTPWGAFAMAMVAILTAKMLVFQMNERERKREAKLAAERDLASTEPSGLRVQFADECSFVEPLVAASHISQQGGQSFVHA